MICSHPQGFDLAVQGFREEALFFNLKEVLSSNKFLVTGDSEFKKLREHISIEWINVQ